MPKRSGRAGVTGSQSGQRKVRSVLSGGSGTVNPSDSENLCAERENAIRSSHTSLGRTSVGVLRIDASMTVATHPPKSGAWSGYFPFNRRRRGASIRGAMPTGPSPPAGCGPALDFGYRVLMSRSGKVLAVLSGCVFVVAAVVVAAAWYYASAIGYPRQSPERRT